VGDGATQGRVEYKVTQLVVTLTAVARFIEVMVAGTVTVAVEELTTVTEVMEVATDVLVAVSVTILHIQKVSVRRELANWVSTSMRRDLRSISARKSGTVQPSSQSSFSTSGLRLGPSRVRDTYKNTFVAVSR
jgi:hypothetical protein